MRRGTYKTKNIRQNKKLTYIKKYENFINDKNKGLSQYSRIDEEIIFKAIKGALSKVMQSFFNAFKDIGQDFKKMFKPEDPNSIKNIVLTNFNQAIDSAQKMLYNKEVDENAINSLMNTIIDNLIELANNLDKNIDSIIGKDKSAGVKAVAKAILLGSKEANWAGIVGLLDPSKGLSGIKTNFKYSKTAYETALTNAGKTGGLKGRKDAAIKFLDNLQKELNNIINRELNEDEVKEIYNEAMKKANQNSSQYNVGDTVVYKREDFDENQWNNLTDEDKSKPYEGKMKELVDKGLIGIKKISKIEGDNIRFEDADFTKKTNDILLKIETTNNNQQDLIKKTTNTISKIKDANKLNIIDKFSEFVSDDKNAEKLKEIEKILSQEK